MDVTDSAKEPSTETEKTQTGTGGDVDTNPTALFDAKKPGSELNSLPDDSQKDVISMDVDPEIDSLVPGLENDGNSVDADGYMSEPESQPPRSPPTEPEEVDPELIKSGRHVVFPWKIKNLRKLTETDGIGRIESEEFECGGHKWRILLFPRGNADSERKAVAGYVENLTVQEDNSSGDKDLRCSFKFEFVADNVKPSVPKESDFVFSETSKDRGFHSILTYQDLEKYYDEEGSAILRLTLTADAPKPKYMLSSYNSRTETGYVGLRNMGATCYMNSLLQALYHIPQFREAVYRIPVTPEDKGEKSIPLALQRVFYSLDTSPSSVDTSKLIKSFGWDSMDAFMQHDIQEFNRVLCDNLEEKMKGTDVEKRIPELFVGETAMYVECLNVDFRSSRTENFYDISLNVKGCKNIYESFDKYVEEEKLEGDNKYRTDDFGLQDAKKYCEFVRFPPILQIHLKRFEYDATTYDMVKINDRYEFPINEDLDLRPFLKERKPDHDTKKQSGANGDKPAAAAENGATTAIQNGGANTNANAPEPVYVLHSILVHSGYPGGGHYYSIIRPPQAGKPVHDSPWFRYDDESVYEVDLEDVERNGFGGVHRRIRPALKKRGKFLSSTNAYMLVYMRKDEAERIGDLLPRIRLPSPVQQRFFREAEEERRIELSKQMAHLFMRVRMYVLPNMLTGHCGVELQRESTDGTASDRAWVMTWKVRKDKPLDLDALSELVGVPVARLHVFRVTKRENRTIRPNTYVSRDQLTKLPCSQNILDKILVADLDPMYDALHGTSLRVDPALSVFLLVKYFDVRKQQLQFAATTTVSSETTFDKVVKDLMDQGKLPRMEHYQVYDEECAETEMVVKKQLGQTMTSMLTGDILLVNEELSPAELSDLKEAHTGPQEFAEDGRMYVSHLANRLTVRLRPVQSHDEDPIDVVVSRKWHYGQLLEQVGKALDPPVAPDLLQIHFRHKFAAIMTTIRPASFYMTAPLEKWGSDVDFTQFFYEILPYSTKLLATHRPVKVHYRDSKLVVHPLTILAPKDGTVQDVLRATMHEVKQEATEEEWSLERMRMWQIRTHRIICQFDYDQAVSDILTDRPGADSKLLIETVSAEMAALEAVKVKADVPTEMLASAEEALRKNSKEAVPASDAAPGDAKAEEPAKTEDDNDVEMKPASPEQQGPTPVVGDAAEDTAEDVSEVTVKAAVDRKALYTALQLKLLPDRFLCWVSQSYALPTKQRLHTYVALEPMVSLPIRVIINKAEPLTELNERLRIMLDVRAEVAAKWQYLTIVEPSVYPRVKEVFSDLSVSQGVVALDALDGCPIILERTDFRHNKRKYYANTTIKLHN